ncbi:hypothetical protein ACIQC5_18850 [Paenarthrobacter sp. NPDC092416]|uniref:hypothetical protein n=1 Tax=Paenarthrobacter sp. NPDC092416 TaxID=3364386 RepID=UPI003825415B
MIINKFKRRTAFIGIGTMALAGIGFGSAMATSSTSQQKTVTVQADTTPSKGTDFKTNERGQTYGSITIVDQQEIEPDLINALATNGELGYVANTELKAASGHPSQFHSPAEALRWQEANGNRAVNIPVYEADGVTKVGQFVIKPSPSEEPK